MSASKKREDSPTTKNLVAHFTKRDLIIYALGIGCCSKEYKGEELRFVYERHPSFEMFPTFLLTLCFAAESDPIGHSGIRPFPPVSMTLSENEIGIIPAMFLKNAVDVQELKHLPILHMSQSLLFHNEILFNNNDTDGDDHPVQINLQTNIISIRPRRIGTFVTTETKFYDQNESCIATAQMTALVFGLSPKNVISLEGRDTDAPTKSMNNKNKLNNIRTEKTIHEFNIPSNAALLYRLSGDYNPIHVEGTGEDDLGDADSKHGPILHGLCTMGYATRAILQHVKRFSKRDMRLTAIECNFVKPVFVGEAIRVEAWSVNDDVDEHVSVWFRVYRSASGEKLVDKGCAKLQIKTTSRL
jgi:acyl dehydratase